MFRHLPSLMLFFSPLALSCSGQTGIEQSARRTSPEAGMSTPMVNDAPGGASVDSLAARPVWADGHMPRLSLVAMVGSDSESEAKGASSTDSAAAPAKDKADGAVDSGGSILDGKASEAVQPARERSELVLPGASSPADSAHTAAYTAVLWPPNNKMVTLRLREDATSEAGQCGVVAIRSNEEIGNEKDFEVVDAHSIMVRAQRHGTGQGRVYTVTAACRDKEGSLVHTELAVFVPPEQGQGAPN